MAFNEKKGPRPRQASAAQGHQLPINLNDYQISYDKEQFDTFISGQGITVVHYRAIPDPTGMLSRGDNHAVASSRASSDGFLYKRAGECKVLFTSNLQDYSIQDEGSISAATAYMTLPRFYSDSPEEAVLVHPWDRFYLKDIEVRVVNFQLIEASSLGVDRLQYPATCVELLVDSSGTQYKQGVDFTITEEGHIKWQTQKRPGWNAELQRGVVYSVRYRYTPFFVCSRLIHEIRVSQVTNPANFQRNVERMPYFVQVVREHVFHDTNRDPKKPDADDRFQDAPPVGGSTGPQVS